MSTCQGAYNRFGARRPTGAPRAASGWDSKPGRAVPPYSAGPQKTSRTAQVEVIFFPGIARPLRHTRSKRTSNKNGNPKPRYFHGLVLLAKCSGKNSIDIARFL